MALIDDRGRLFGRINLIDFTLLVFVIGLVPLAYGAYLLFRTPAPIVTGVTPNSLVYKKGEQRVRVTGEHLRPFMRATIGGKDAKAFLVERRDVAEVAFDDLPVGTYDLALFDFAEEVTRFPNALKIVPPPLPPVQAVGRFVGATAASAALVPGAKLGAADNPIEIVSIDPPGGGERPATLRLSCVGSPCAVGGASFEAGKAVSLPLTGAADGVRFAVDEMRVDGLWADVQVRLFGIVEALQLVQPGDVDQFQQPDTTGLAPMVSGAVVRTVAPSTPTQGVLTLNFSHLLPDVSSFNGSLYGAGYAPLSTRLATLRVPLQSSTNGWRYRDQFIRPGSGLTLETPDYLLRGLILRVNAPRAAAQNRSQP